MGIKTVLLKLTGECFLDPATRQLNGSFIRSIASQIKAMPDYYFGIVIGGGNFFRGSKEGAALGLTPSVGHQVGMLATMMNGLLIKDLFEQEEIHCSLFCAVPSPEVGSPISQQAIMTAQAKGHCLIFSGGTGNPFFTTDTTAILRGLQINAQEIWKGTHIDGIYSSDPRKDPHAVLLPSVSYKQALHDDLKIMDATAFALAAQHKLLIRVFNIFEPHALLKVAQDRTFGSCVQ